MFDGDLEHVAWHACDTHHPCDINRNSLSLRATHLWHACIQRCIDLPNTHTHTVLPSCVPMTTSHFLFHLLSFRDVTIWMMKAVWALLLLRSSLLHCLVDLWGVQSRGVSRDNIIISRVQSQSTWMLLERWVCILLLESVGLKHDAQLGYRELVLDERGTLRHQRSSCKTRKLPPRFVSVFVNTMPQRLHHNVTLSSLCDALACI